MLVSESKNSSLTKFLKLYDSTSSLRLKPMLRAVSLLRKFSAMPLVKCACTSMTKNSLFGYFSSIAASSKVSASSTSNTFPYTRLDAAKQVASPIELAMNARRSMLSLRARAAPSSRISASSCF